MKAVILAAGEGSRMRPLTYTRPKVMLPIANKPVLEHLLIEASAAGIGEFIFVVGYHDEAVLDYFGDGSKWSVRIDYVKQRRQLGTADALKMVADLTEGIFLLMNGDMVIGRQDIAEMAGSEDTTLAVIEVSDPRGLGVVEAGGGRVVRIYEKEENPPSRLANAGLYLLTPEIFDAIARTVKSPRGEYELTDSLTLLIEAGHNIGCHTIGQWLDISYPWDLLTANEALMSDLKAQNSGEVEANAVVKGAVSIGRNTVVRSGTYIIGPAVIGENCEIGPNCYIRPCTAIGDNCHIGNAVEVKNCIIMRNTKLPHHNYAGDSVIGEGCNFGAGTKIANLRLDKEDIWIEGINTGRRKLGAIIGDMVETGINASINVGSMLGDHTFIGPGALAKGIIAPGSRIF
ncbi:MAG TPA: NTP transferase domain-containing protein [Dehalococcoidia bacterium]|nr:NTP transferase domain-containing protein [Dehalococcoidia bacterium]